METGVLLRKVPRLCMSVPHILERPAQGRALFSYCTGSAATAAVVTAAPTVVPTAAAVAAAIPTAIAAAAAADDQDQDDDPHAAAAPTIIATHSVYLLFEVGSRRSDRPHFHGMHLAQSGDSLFSFRKPADRSLTPEPAARFPNPLLPPPAGGPAAYPSLP